MAFLGLLGLRRQRTRSNDLDQRASYHVEPSFRLSCVILPPLKLARLSNLAASGSRGVPPQASRVSELRCIPTSLASASS